jgi:parallel beta-helix repeat protein
MAYIYNIENPVRVIAMVKPIFNRIIATSIILILLFTSNQLNLNQPRAIFPVTAETIIVNINGSGNFTSIQDAIDQAERGDTVFVKPGIYYENITINKTINLIGSGTEHTTIIGDQVRAVIKLESNNSRISGFTIAGYYCYSDIYINGSYNTISDCYCYGSVIGIDMRETKYNLVVNSTCETNSGAGIYLAGASHSTFNNISCYNSTYGPGIYLWYATDNTFKNGTCSANQKEGLYAYWLSDRNKIVDYEFTNNNRSGVHLFDSDKFQLENCVAEQNNGNGFIVASLSNTLINCTSNSNSADGFYMYHSEGSKFEKCLSLSNSGRGFYFKYSIDNQMKDCTIISNGNFGLQIDGNSESNIIYHNNFIDNNQGTTQAMVASEKNVWYENGRGNYWWDFLYFTNNATNSGEIWNSPYSLSNKLNIQDTKPLIEPTIDKKVIENMYPGIFQDTDSDGVFDVIDELPEEHGEWLDTDSDGIGNFKDSDDDNDGLSDIDELEKGTEPLNNDTDGDNYNDSEDAYPLDPKLWEPVNKKKDKNEQNIDQLIFIIFLIVFLLILFLILIPKMVKKRKKNENKRK